MVDFCDKCGSIIMGKKGEAVECPSCGAKSKAKSTVEIKQKVEKKEQKEVMNTNIADEVHPTTTQECPECGNDQAYYWSKQMRAGDEPETQFFKCTMCKHKWRKYM